MKKVISLLLSLTMLLSIVSVVDFSAYAYVETGKCGDNLTYSLDTSKGVLTISGTGKMTDYLMGNPFSKFNVKTVIIENGVTSIGYQAFCGCTRVVDVIVPDSVTSIGDSAFYNCQKLNNITIPNSVTSIGNSVFYNCTNLLRITLPGLENIGKYSLCECPNLRRIEYYGTKNQWNKICKLQNNSKLNNVETFCIDGLTGSFDPITYSTKDYLKFKIDDNVTLVGYDKNKMKSKNINVDSIEFAGFKFNVTSIGNSAFRSCTSLTSVIIPNSVTSIGRYAFSGCANLTSITIPDSVTSIGGYAFSGCTSLTSVTIGNSVTSIDESAFENCTRLTSVTIPNSVERIGIYAFKNCTSLTSVTIPDSVTSIGDDAFYECRSLESVTIGNNVTNIGSSAFNWCNNLTDITIPDSVTTIGPSAFSNTAYYNDKSNWDKGVLYLSNCLIDTNDDLTDYTIKDGTRIIANNAFYNCTSLTSVTIPDSVTSIGDYAFYGCTNLIRVNYSGTKSQWKAITIGYDNSYLTRAIIICTDGIIGKGNTVTIDNLEYKIYDDTTSLVGYVDTPENLMIPESVWYEGYTFKVTSIGRLAFDGCTSLTRVTIPDSVTSIGDSAFYGCTSLTSVTIGNSVTSIGESAFKNCTSLTSVNYSGTKSQWKAITIGSDNSYLTRAFIKCTDGIIGNGNTVTVDSVIYRLNDDYTAQVISYSGTPGNITISECVSYESYTFKVTSIGSSAFKDCTNLTSVTIPNSVTSIGDYAFEECTSLTSITIPDSVTTIGNNAFSGCSSLTSATIPNSVESIGDNAFNGCSKLKKIEIPDSVTYIGSKAFDGTAFYNTVKNWEDGVLYCGNHLISAKSDVTKITVKASTVSIAAGALDNCESLKKINVLNPKCVINCTIPKTAVIGGAEGSTAEDFAQKNNMSIDYFEECIHSDKVQVVIAATCTEQGAVQSRCADCNKLISQTFTAPLGHTMVITTPAKAPTCTTSGNTQAGYCTVCGYNEVSTVIPATGHNFGNNSANCLVCGVANPNYVAPTQPNQNDTNTSNDEDVTVISKPKSASIKKVKGAKKAISVTWKKVSGVNGYEIQVATDKKFKKNKKTVTIKKQKTTKTTVKKLKAKKKYYVRVRTYKIVNGKKVYSSWSKVKSVKTK